MYGKTRRTLDANSNQVYIFWELRNCSLQRYTYWNILLRFSEISALFLKVPRFTNEVRFWSNLSGRARCKLLCLRDIFLWERVSENFHYLSGLFLTRSLPLRVDKTCILFTKIVITSKRSKEKILCFGLTIGQRLPQISAWNI